MCGMFPLNESYLQFHHITGVVAESSQRSLVWHGVNRGQAWKWSNLGWRQRLKTDNEPPPVRNSVKHVPLDGRHTTASVQLSSCAVQLWLTVYSTVTASASPTYRKKLSRIRLCSWNKKKIKKEVKDVFFFLSPSDNHCNCWGEKFWSNTVISQSLSRQRERGG